jgi:type IV pilus assembly protein PilX
MMQLSQFKVNSKYGYLRMQQQQGFALFVALIALVVMSLAAVALIRSVDTNNLIAGNLAFKQAATTSADAGTEAAITKLMGMRDLAANSTKNVLNDATHTFNQTCLTATAPCTAANPGYFSSADPTLNLTADATWNDVNNVKLTWDAAGVVKNDGSGAVLTDNSGNTIQYIIQRMCRTPNVAIQNAGCLFSTAAEDKDGQQVKLPQNVCDGSGCPVAGQTPQVRVTVRVTGPKNSVSYIQTFIY